MSSEYVCGIIRDNFKRFLVVEYASEFENPMISITAESWIGKDESADNALTAELGICLGVSLIDNFNIIHSKELINHNFRGNQIIHVKMLELKTDVTFKFTKEIANISFLSLKQIQTLVKTGQVTNTIYLGKVLAYLTTLEEI